MFDPEVRKCLCFSLSGGRWSLVVCGNSKNTINHVARYDKQPAICNSTDRTAMFQEWHYVKALYPAYLYMRTYALFDSRRCSAR